MGVNVDTQERSGSLGSSAQTDIDQSGTASTSDGTGAEAEGTPLVNYNSQTNGISNIFILTIFVFSLT